MAGQSNKGPPVPPASTYGHGVPIERKPYTKYKSNPSKGSPYDKEQRDWRANEREEQKKERYDYILRSWKKEIKDNFYSNAANFYWPEDEGEWVTILPSPLSLLTEQEKLDKEELESGWTI